MPADRRRTPRCATPSSPPPRSRDLRRRYRRRVTEPSIDPTVARCSWAGASGPRPDPLMVRYHDDEWATPCHDDVELFERLVLESFQAGLSWATILRKREAVRTAFVGFDPALGGGVGASGRRRGVGRPRGR